MTRNAKKQTLPLGGRGKHATKTRFMAVLAATSSALAMAQWHSAHALNLYSAGNLEINLDTTVEYSTFYRVNDPSKILLNSPRALNYNDGDQNFQHGIVANELSVLPVLDVKDGNYGMHVSGQVYLNTPYLGTNQNGSPYTNNALSIAKNNDFTSATRNVNGENAQLLDAFAYGSFNFGANNGQELTVKVGRQTLIWGQSLFFANNGIAAGQAPINILTAESVPNAQAQQIFMPVGQAVVTYQPNQILTFQAYYQFEWRQDFFQGSGAYFSNIDFFDKGGQRLFFAAPNPFFPGVYVTRTRDLTPSNANGQFGAAAMASLGNYDLGLYALRFDSKSPEVYTDVTSNGVGNIGKYWLVYPRDIQMFGASLSTTVGPVNVAGEISGRKNMPLVQNPFPPPGVANTAYPGSGNAGALYPVGSTVAAQVSGIYITPPLPLDPGGMTIIGEFAMNHVVSVDSGRNDLEPGRSPSAGAFEIVATPAYYDVLPNLELQFPIGLTYNLFGRSQVDLNMNHGTGSVSFGVTATYRTTWIAGLTYNTYLGRPDPILNPLADRGYLSFNIQHTF